MTDGAVFASKCLITDNGPDGVLCWPPRLKCAKIRHCLYTVSTSGGMNSLIIVSLCEYEVCATLGRESGQYIVPMNRATLATSHTRYRAALVLTPNTVDAESRTYRGLRKPFERKTSTYPS